jgi:hypothetical protein
LGKSLCLSKQEELTSIFSVGTGQNLSDFLSSKAGYFTQNAGKTASANAMMQKRWVLPIK